MKKTTAQIVRDELKKAKLAKQKDLVALSGKVDGLSGKVNTLSGRVDGLSGKFDGLSGRVDTLSGRVDSLSGRVDGNSGRIDGLTKKVDDISSRMDQVNDAARIIQENEQTLKDLGGLKHRLDVLDKIFVTVDKIAGDVTSYREMQELNSNKLSNHDDRIERVEKHLHIPTTV